MNILQISFESLMNPPVLTQGLAFMFGIFILGFLYSSLRLRSTFGMFGVLLMVIALITSFITNMSLLWFWVMVMLEIIILVISSIVYTRAATRTKN